MLRPDPTTLEKLRELQHTASSVGKSPEAVDVLQRIIEKYESWLVGKWRPTELELKADFAELFALAVGKARKAGVTMIATHIAGMWSSVVREHENDPIEEISRDIGQVIADHVSRNPWLSEQAFLDALTSVRNDVLDELHRDRTAVVV